MTRLATIVLLVAFFFTSAAFAQTIDAPDWKNSVHFELYASQDSVRPGDKLWLAVVAEIEAGYHLYGPEERKPSRTEVLAEGKLIESDPAVFPPTISRDLAGLGEFALYEGKVAIRIPISIKEGAVLEREVGVDVRVNYQVCTDSACSAPTNQTLVTVLPVVEEGQGVGATHPEIFETAEYQSSN